MATGWEALLDSECERSRILALEIQRLFEVGNIILAEPMETAREVLRRHRVQPLDTEGEVCKD